MLQLKLKNKKIWGFLSRILKIKKKFHRSRNFDGIFSTQYAGIANNTNKITSIKHTRIRCIVVIFNLSLAICQIEEEKTTQKNKQNCKISLTIVPKFPILPSSREGNSQFPQLLKNCPVCRSSGQFFYVSNLIKKVNVILSERAYVKKLIKECGVLSPHPKSFIRNNSA